jgi:ubiquinone/menaquinone biosynthesis C-methylase UbiE
MNKVEAQSYRSIATEVFAPVYSYYANKIVARTGIRSGFCLDLGSGAGHLGLALLQIACFRLFLLDHSQEMLPTAEERSYRVTRETITGIVLAEVQAIPLQDSCVDLAVSRGSVPFWSDLPVAFREINRVLKPGGYACILGGLGPPEMRKSIERQMHLRNPNWQKDRNRNIPHREPDQYARSLTLAGIHDFTVDRNDTGMWIEFRKPQSRSNE